MWGLIVIHSKQVFRSNCVCFNEVPLYFIIVIMCIHLNVIIFVIIIQPVDPGDEVIPEKAGEETKL